ncbi:MAG: aspartate kinase [Desulfobacterales bacterium]|nr:aspartate kinase [Desulfobacterales bacterium]
MGLIVQKYGGTSVANKDRIENVAKRVIKDYDAGNDIVVVVSAMAGVTDGLINLAKTFSENPDKRELDVLLATGEQTTSSLLAMMLVSMGYKAVSLLGHQVEIITDNASGSARILTINTEKIKKYLQDKYIIVVPGFQGHDQEGNITTLGRGGSDTSAVAVASALNADVCEIYTDVDGVYTTDPNVCNKARKLKKISYEEMLEMASLGAKVLQIRSVEFGKKYNMPIHVRSSFNNEEGTMVVNEDSDMERVVVSGVTYNKNEARITLKKVPDQPGIASKIFSPIAEKGIVVDIILQNTRADGRADLTFTVSKTDYKEALALSKKIGGELGASEVLGDPNISKVSVIGVGMKSHAGVAAKTFATLAATNINIIMISTSEIRISCIIEEKYTELAVRELHSAFGLDIDNS